MLYIVQCVLGAVIHWIKPKRSSGRPPQNYLHAILGLIIIALAFYQVRDGYSREWPKTTGRGNLPNGVNIVWYIWVVVSQSPYPPDIMNQRDSWRSSATSSSLRRRPCFPAQAVQTGEEPQKSVRQCQRFYGPIWHAAQIS